MLKPPCVFVQALSGTVIGISAHTIKVEAHRGRGLPQISLVGMARGAVKESIVRVRAALSAIGAPALCHKIVLNLLPAELPKEGSGLDLAIAAVLLAVAQVIPPEALLRRRFYGEMSLGGGLEPVSGGILLGDLSRLENDAELLIGAKNASQAAVIPNTRVIPIQHLRDLIGHLKGEAIIPPVLPAEGDEVGPEDTVGSKACLSEVVGQAQAKKAMEVAAAGRHHLLFMGPPGSGKTMLASRLPSIMPPMTLDERIEITRIAAVSQMDSNFDTLLNRRPFRSPHHTASDVALCGGGSRARPGEVTLAHRGVLFLDEMAEFSKRALEGLREPIEQGAIDIVRAEARVHYPASVLLIGATNPCPCGYYGFQRPGVPACFCAYESVMRYRNRFSGPLLDRIDLQVLVEPIPYSSLIHRCSGESSADIQARVIAARKRQAQRLGPQRCNRDMHHHEIQRDVHLDAESNGLLEKATEQQGLSSRAITRILKVTRTIADLDDSDKTQKCHLEEALSLRKAGLAYREGGK